MDIIEYSIKVNSFEMGILVGVISELDDRQKQALKPVWEQLIALKKQFEEEAGVKKEIIPGGLLKLSDKFGNTIIREPYSWEVEGN